MAKTAIISDIHGNLEALEAVLREIMHMGIDEIWCLGDIVGYGPNPIECTDLVRRNCSTVLMGNHDWALLNSPVGFNTLATAMIYKTKEMMRVTGDSDEEDEERWQFLSQLPLSAEIDGKLLVHGSPRAELSEYVLPSDVTYDPRKFDEIFSVVDRALFVGHSHIPCIITPEPSVHLPQEHDNLHIDLNDPGKHLINIGSVGQPRDGDTRACFVSIQNDVVRYHRVRYDYQRTGEKISALGEEYEMLGYRLTLGR
jgi:predicted phosphodiesterase